VKALGHLGVSHKDFNQLKKISFKSRLLLNLAELQVVYTLDGLLDQVMSFVAVLSESLLCHEIGLNNLARLQSIETRSNIV
jgi:hypothetical protein